MTPASESIQEQIAKYNWYQSIELKDGIVTPGETGLASQNKLAMMNLPQELSGKSVLDIGCNEGFFSFEAERRGATRVVAIDKGKDAREKFSLIHGILQSSVEFLELDLTEIKPSRFGRFDLVFFLAVLHHLRHPFWAFDQVFALTGEVAILEFVEAVSEAQEQERPYAHAAHAHHEPGAACARRVLQGRGAGDAQGEGRWRASGDARVQPPAGAPESPQVTTREVPRVRTCRTVRVEP